MPNGNNKKTNEQLPTNITNPGEVPANLGIPDNLFNIKALPLPKDLVGVGNTQHPQLLSPERINLIFRLVSALVLFILGFNFSNSYFFDEFPLFGVRYLAEILISTLCALIGMYVLPVLLLQARYWLETLVVRTVYGIVVSFWDQQTKRMAEVRRVKQQKKSEDADTKFKQDIEDALLLDTSVLIDGRILNVVKTGFVHDNLIIIKSVLDELHLISDNPDQLKRQRGRKGLDAINDLKKVTKVIFPTTQPAGKGADSDLVAFAAAHKVRLLTLDFNLNKVAKASGIKVLNLNDLASSLKAVVLPGEILRVKIIEAGKEKEQGLAYMADGTMIVVQDGKQLVGQEIDVKVSKLIQTSAGKMIFGVVAGGTPSATVEA